MIRAWPRRQARIVSYGLALVVIAFDQITKAIIVAVLGNDQARIVIVPNVLELIFRLNTGMAFSLLINFPQLLTLVALAASVGLAVLVWRLSTTAPLARLALGLLLGGAIGNLIDRLRIGAVIDFIYFVPINFPAFNVADSALTIGVLLAAWAMSRSEPDASPT